MHCHAGGWLHIGAGLMLSTAMSDLQVQETEIYSRISPYTEPAIGKITTSPYYQATVSHLKPIAVNGKA
jgi:hypothetical protein